MRPIAELIHRRARLVLALTAILTVAAGVFGAGVIGSLSNGGSSDPSAPSEVSARQIAAATGVPVQPGLVVLVRTPAPVLSAVGRRLVARVAGAVASQKAFLRTLSVLDVRQSNSLVSRDGRATVVLGYFGVHTSEHAATAAAQRVAHELRGVPGVSVGGDQL